MQDSTTLKLVRGLRVLALELVIRLTNETEHDTHVQRLYRLCEQIKGAWVAIKMLSSIYFHLPEKQFEPGQYNTQKEAHHAAVALS